MASNNMKASFPPSDEIVTVSMISSTKFGPSILKRFMAPPVPGLETFKTVPSLSFFIEHSSGRRLVFDLGIRKDWQNYAPKIATYIPTTNYEIIVEKHVGEILTEHDISLSSVEAVIWSHWHWDHTGDPSTFPSSTDLIVGPGFKGAMLPGAPTNPDSPINEADFALVSHRNTARTSKTLLTSLSNRTLREIEFDDANSLTIGSFRAYDYFNDGSFYLLDSPGHAVGHLCGLARTTNHPPTFALLGGDICHYAGIFRPSKYLPVPSSISPHPCGGDRKAPFCPGHAWEELQTSRQRTMSDTLFDMTFGLDIPLATKTMRKLQELDHDENVFVMIAHDAGVRDGVPHFPQTLNDWKEKGYGRDLKWAFLGDLAPYLESAGVI